MSTLRVGVVQHDIAWEQPAETFARLEGPIAAAAGGGAQLVVLSEMFGPGFSMAAERIAEPYDGPSARFLITQATTLGVWVCGSVPEHRPNASEGARPANTLILASPDGTTQRYRKIHPFTYAGEHDHYEAGTEFLTVEVGGARISFFVCYDLRFADEFWAVAPQTDAYVVVANWPESRRLPWQALLQARAIENQAYVVGCNRVGEGGGLAYCGDSRVVDPLGEVLTSAARIETVLFADIVPAHVADVRARFPFLQDRR